MSYERLAHLSKKIHILEGINQLLEWDQETYMPEGAVTARAEQRELIAEIAHTYKTSEDYKALLSKLIDVKKGTIKQKSLKAEQKDALKVWRKEFVQAAKLPTEFVQKLTKLSSESLVIWQKAKKTNNFALFAPYLEKIVKLTQEKAEYLGYTEHPYDALLDEYEPEATTKKIGTLFNSLKKPLKKLLEKVENKCPQYNLPKTTQEEQVAICKIVLDLIGFSWKHGRLDLSSHPFCSTYHPLDSRITTRLEASDTLIQIFTTLHEAGHSFYDTGLPINHYGTPLGQFASLGIHESQSRFWETRVGKTKAFWKTLLPILQKKLPHIFKKVDINALYLSMNQVKRSFIRTDADEVTYPLHVILRFEIEKELIEGSLKVKDLPKRWNSGMKELIGVTPKNDREGCLQDIHWSMAGFGYFPTYTLGNIYAAQIFHNFSTTFPKWEKQIEKGTFTFIHDYLREKIWQHGRRFSPIELIQRATDCPIDSSYYINYLENKYLSLFG